MKRILAMLLAFALLAGLMPAAVAANSTPGQDRQVLTAEEISDVSRLDEPAREAEERTVQPYQPDDLVTVIVELEQAPVLEHYVPNVLAGESAGAAVSAYLTGDAARQESLALQDSQTAAIAQIRKAADAGSDFQVTNRWTTLINAVSVQVPYGKLEEIRSLEGVKRAYVEHVYDRPVEELADISTGGIYGYSYNMTGLGAAWEAGLTGQGMLVAILDTGLDLNYTAWGDSANLNVGIRRVHEAFTDDSFMHDPDDAESGWELRYTNESLRLFLESTQLRATTGADGSKLTWSNNALYKNRKVPYACDYADGDVNVQPTDSDHGTHVSGTVAGYAESEEGEVLFSGVAPDAQILAMKVFPDADGGATEGAIINALEDAALLGADVVNLSLGSDNGFAEDDSAANEVYGRLNATGILFMTSAGNASSSSAYNNYGGYNLSSDPEISMMSAPAIYDSNLSVASMENTVEAQSVLTWTGPDGAEHTVPFQDTTGVAMKYKFAGQTPVNVIPVDGYGTYEDYYNAGFRSYYGYGDKGVEGVALVKRGGGISFVDKINAAINFSWSYYDSSKGYYVTEYPVKAVLIYDEDPNATELISMSTDGTSLTAAFITGKDGAALAEAAKSALAAGGNVTMTVQQEDVISPSETGGQMSSFSSWGAGPGLELKPEITAPGGNIWSAILDQAYSPSNPGGSYDDYVGSYGMMSGTSMAAPHMTGLTALVEQYVRQELQVTAKKAVGSLAAQLLVSTAVPQKDPDGVYYSPRQQGAGLVNIAGAISTPAYISVDGQSVGKLELKDDPEKTGSYEMTFHVHNLTPETLNYNATAVLLRPAAGTADSVWGEKSVLLDSDALIREVDLGAITVPASQTVRVSRTVSLTAEEKALLGELFANGTYVEGFVILTDSEGSNPQIGLPFLAYYGDWTAAPIFDSALWTDVPADGENVLGNEAEWGVSILGYFDGYNYYNLGQNPFDGTAGTEQGVFLQENITISPTGFYKTINDYILYQKREAKVMVVEVKDAETGELYYRDHTAYQFKSYYNASAGMVLPSSLYYFTGTNWEGTDLNGNVLPSGTECIYTITAYGDGEYPVAYDAEAGREVTRVESVVPGEVEPTFNGHAMDMTGDVISVHIMVDTVAPKLVNSAVSAYEKDGRKYIAGTFEDDGSIASVEVYPLVKRTYKEGYGDPGYAEYGLDRNNSFYSEMIYDADVREWKFEADVSEYAHINESYAGENNYYDFTWTGNVYIYGGDYGGNDRSYAVSVNTDSGLVLSTTSGLMYVGDTFDLSVNNNTGSDAALTRTSSNPEVATIDEFGHVEALAPGQTVLTVSNGTSSAVCVIAVRERSTEIVDFNLSVESFSGLKPNGAMIVKVTDLQPSDVELTEVRWEVTEDDPDLYAGLINCARYSSDGLTGEIYLNSSATGDPGIRIPGAKGTLTVTLNGVSRQMHFDWEDLYTYTTDDDLISDLPFYEQISYVTLGETATLSAKYNDTSAHIYCPVALYTAKNYVNYSYDNVTDPAEGLALDGPDFCSVGSSWTGKLVNQEGYALPETIRVFTRYNYGYEYELTNSWRTDYTYNNQTGEITVNYTPETTTSTLVIRADGVVSEGNPAGQTGDAEFEKPEGLYGPFDWELVSGSGTLTVEENVEVNGTVKNLAYYEPSEAGVSIVKATTKDGKYALNLAVVAEPVMPESLSLDVNSLRLHVAETKTLTATLTPEPTLEKHAAVQWKSYNPEVAAVDETGTVTAVSAGYAYITAINRFTGAMSYCVVEVQACEHGRTTTKTVPATCTTDGSVTVLCDLCGEVISTEILQKGHDYEAVVTAPACTEGGYTTYTCKVCGDSYKSDLTEALGHDYVVAVVEPQEGTEGYTLHTCARCGYSYRDAFTTVGVCPSARFTDVDPDRWYHKGVDFAVSNELMNGVSETLFRPNGTLTRGQVVTVLYRMAGAPETEGRSPFTDVKTGRFYSDAVTWAAENGIVKGVTESLFVPDAPVTREQLVTFLARYAAELDQVEIGGQGSLHTYSDAASVSHYAVEAMTWAVSNGVIDGMDGKLAPKGTATRAQLATILMRYCETFGE